MNCALQNDRGGETRSQWPSARTGLQGPHVHVSVPDLAAAFELQRQDPLPRAVRGTLVDADGDHLSVQYVHQRVPARDDLDLLPLAFQPSCGFTAAVGVVCTVPTRCSFPGNSSTIPPGG